jgi:transcriptional antiterminator RfaH
MNWFCIHTKPKKESQVSDCLQEALGFETYCPMLRQYRTIRRVRRLVTSPLFPRYIFCRFDSEESYRYVRYSHDVIDIVQFGGQPAVVSDPLIADLKAWAGIAFDLSVIRSDFRAGDSVKITNGPLRGVAAIILHARDDADRIEILLTLLQQGARMTIPRDQLELMHRVVA